MAAIDLYSFELSPELISRIPADERLFFLGLGHVSNELNVLQKLVLLSQYPRSGINAVNHGQVLQSLVLIKLCASKACAGYDFLKSQMGKPFYPEYSTDPDGAFADGARILNRYFGTDSLLRYVRNKFGAHYDDGAMTALVDHIPDQTLHLYVSDQQGLSFNFASEEILFEALATRARDNENVSDIMDRLIDDMITVTGALNDCAQGVNIVITKRYAADDWNVAEMTPQTIELVDAKDARIPFFVNFRSMGEED